MSSITTTTTTTKAHSPKKILIQKYNEDLESIMIRNYASRLFLTWIYKSATPPTLAPIPQINLAQQKPIQPLFMLNQQLQQQQQALLQQQSQKTLSPAHSSLADIEIYVNRVVDILANVIYFFHSQHCKRHNLINKSNPNATHQNTSDTLAAAQNESTVYNSIFVGCIYYADLFVRKNNSSNTSILDVLVVR
eukprot:gene15751-18715_t